MNGLAPNGQYGYLFPSVAAGFQVAGTPDLNGDGKTDLVVVGNSSFNGASVNVLLGNGDGR